MKFEVYCDFDDRGTRGNFYIIQEDFNGTTQSICTSLDNMEFKKFEPGEDIEPTFILKGLVVKPFLQAMANKLDELGIRAETKPILENELTAIKYHLEDMRKLVFKQ